MGSLGPHLLQSSRERPPSAPQAHSRGLREPRFARTRPRLHASQPRPLQRAASLCFRKVSRLQAQVRSADQQAAPGRLLRLRKGPPGEAARAGRGGEADTQLPSDALSWARGERAQHGACARPPLQLASPCAARRWCSSGAVASRAPFCQQSNRRAARPRAAFSTAPLA